MLEPERLRKLTRRKAVTLIVVGVGAAATLPLSQYLALSTAGRELKPFTTWGQTNVRFAELKIPFGQLLGQFVHYVPLVQH